MEMEEIQTQGCSKFARISNGNGKMQNLDEEDDGGGGEGGGGGGGGGSGGGGGGFNISSSHGVGSLCGWPSSRIVRVSRASGGKDRHSKVLTSKGLRDRRVRLSVNTAIQFYDLQDRLGYDQPSKAVEWLLKAAAPSIAELPSLNPPFAAADSQQLSDGAAAAGIEQPPLDSTAAAEIELEADQNFQQRSLSLSKSCSSTSETSKGSGGLSLSRSESRIKARERARERAAKDKEKENDGGASHHHQNLNPISSSFTELLTGTTSPSPNSSVHQTRGENTNFFAKSPRNWDYFTSAAYSGNMNLTNPLHHHHQHFSELQQFSFVSDHLAPVVTAAPPGNNNNHHYHHHNLNFSISPSSGFNNNRGTLQSNSSSSSSPSSLLPHFQRFDGSSSSSSFFTISTAPPNANPLENHHNFLPGFDARLQLYYGDPHAAAHRHSDHKGKDKS